MSLARDSRSRPRPGGSPPPDLLFMGAPPLMFYHRAAYVARGRIFPVPARGTPHP
jgi:hypothetical protein